VQAKICHYVCHSSCLCSHSIPLFGTGGHFAASVFKARSLESQPGKQGAKDAFEVLAHKTCHRYVIRCVPYQSLLPVPTSLCLSQACTCTHTSTSAHNAPSSRTPTPSLTHLYINIIRVESCVFYCILRSEKRSVCYKTRADTAMSLRQARQKS